MCLKKNIPSAGENDGFRPEGLCEGRRGAEPQECGYLHCAFSQGPVPVCLPHPPANSVGGHATGVSGQTLRMPVFPRSKPVFLL